MVTSRLVGLSTYYTYWGIVYLGGGAMVQKTGKGFGGWRVNGQSEELYFLLVDESGFMIVASLDPIEERSDVKLG